MALLNGAVLEGGAVQTWWPFQRHKNMYIYVYIYMFKPGRGPHKAPESAGDGGRGPPQISSDRLRSLDFEMWVEGPVGHPQGVQIKTFIFNIKCFPNPERATTCFDGGGALQNHDRHGQTWQNVEPPTTIKKRGGSRRRTYWRSGHIRHIQHWVPESNVVGFLVVAKWP